MSVVVDRGGVNVSERRQDQQQRAVRRVCGWAEGMSVVMFFFSLCCYYCYHHYYLLLLTVK